MAKRKAKKKQPDKTPEAPEAFFTAALEGNLKDIQSFLKKGIDPNSRTKGGATALMFAAHGGHQQVIDYLLDHGANPNLKDDNGYIPLMIAGKAGHLEIARRLIIAKSDVHARAEHALTPLILACQDGRIEIVKLLLGNGANPNDTTEKGASALLFCAAGGYLDVATILVQHGAQVNTAEEQQGQTPLMVAANRGNSELMRLLLQNGANPNAMAKDGKTALMMACGNGHLDCARQLLSKGADTNAVENELGLTALMAAVVSGHEAIARVLLENGANVNAQSKTGHTALIYASRNGSKEIVSLLLAYKANVFAKNQHNEDATMHARAGEHDDVIDLLVEAREKQSKESKESMAEYGGQALLELCSLGDTYLPQVRAALEQGAGTEVKNQRGFTPLLLAAYFRYPGITRALLEHGADVNAVEDTGGTPLYWACFGGNAEIARILMENGASLNPKIWEAAQNNGAKEIMDLLLSAAAKASGHPAGFQIPCNCNSLTMTTSPKDEQAKGLVTIVHEDVHQGWSEIYCICNSCRRRWKVTEDTGYHYTTYSWEELKTDGPLKEKFVEAETHLQTKFLPFSEYQSKKQKLRSLIRQNPEAAKEAAEVVLFFDPQDLFALLILGMSCATGGKTEKAKEIQEIVSNGKWAKAQIEEVQEFLQQLLKESRLELLRYGTEFAKPFTGEDPDQLFASAVARAGGGDPAGARELLERVVKLKPEHYDAWYNLGLTYMETQQPQDAIACFERGLALSPDNHSIQFQLARALEDMGDQKRALKAFEEAYRTKPSWGGQRDYSQQIEAALARLKDPKADLEGGHAREVVSLAFSQDGKILVSGSLDSTIRIWEPTTGKPLMKLTGHTNRVDSVALSPDGHFLASWECLANRYLLWNLIGGKQIRNWTGVSISVWKIAFSPDNLYLAIEADKTNVVLIDLATRQEVKRMSGHTDEVTCIAFHPEKALLATGSRDNTVRIWNTATCSEVKRFENHKKVLGSVAFSPNGKLVASGAYDGLLCVWEVDGWKQIIAHKDEGSAIKNIIFAPDSTRIYYISQHTIQVLDLETQQPKVLIPKLSVVPAFALSPDGELLATGHTDYDDCRIRVWRLATKKVLWQI